MNARLASDCQRGKTCGRPHPVRRKLVHRDVRIGSGRRVNMPNAGQKRVDREVPTRQTMIEPREDRDRISDAFERTGRLAPIELSNDLGITAASLWRSFASSLLWEEAIGVKTQHVPDTDHSTNSGGVTTSGRLL